MVKIRLTIRNRVAYLEQPYPYEALLPFWSYSVPNYNYIRRFYPGWDGKKKLLKYNRLPAGLFWATRKDIEAATGCRFKVDYEHPELIVRKRESDSEEKYHFQDECEDAMVRKYIHGKGGLILNATGSGKTRIAGKFFKRVKGECVFIVDQLNLLDQAKKALQKFLKEKVGYVGDSKFKLRRVTVATVQTLFERRDSRKFENWFRRVKVIIIDEIHEQLNERTGKVLAAIPHAPVFGLTATLELKRKDVRLPAWSVTGPVIYTYPLKKGMKDKVLAGGVVVRVLYENKISHYDRSGKKEMLYSDRIVANAERNSIISSIVRYGVRRGYYGIALVRRLDHMRRLSNRLNKRGLEHKLVAGTVRGKHMKVAERVKVTKRFEDEKVKLIISNQVFKKGVDIKRVDMMVDGAAMKSKNDALQKFGRGIRLHDKKRGLLYFDISDVDTKPQWKRVESGKSKGKKKLKYHSYHRAARSRRSAYKAVGLTVVDFKWGQDGEEKELYRLAEKTLQKELKKIGGR